MVNALFDLPDHLRKRLTGALDSGLLIPPYSTATVRAVLGRHIGVEEIVGAVEQLEKLGISGRAAAAWIRTVEGITSRVGKPDLVWSGPEVPGVHARDTRRVYEELLGSAEHSIWASTYAFFDGPKAFDVLAQRMDAKPKLGVTLFLNIQRNRGDTTPVDQLVRRFADRFWNTEWPGSRHPRVYYDPRALELEGPVGVLHAKAIVADDEAIFVTSANLTEAALDRNIEVGLLVRDRALAATLSSHFKALIEQRLLQRLPAE
jgi:phosphatidylserine/phosphatidylglycerophosphate/cardiolipin synthase-like enzyme